MVVGHGPDDLLDVGPVLVAELGKLVGEADLRRQEEVCAELAERGVGRTHLEDRRAGLAVQAAKLMSAVAGHVVGDAEDDPLGLEEVPDGRAFLGEFGVEEDRDLGPTGLLADPTDDRRQMAEEPWRQRRADDQDGPVGQARDDVVEAGLDRPGLPAAVAIVRPDGDEHDIGVGHGGRVGREREATIQPVGFHQLGEARLVERHPTVKERLNARLGYLDTHHVMALLRKAG